MQMVELLVVLGISTSDALLHAIDKEFVEGITIAYRWRFQVFESRQTL